MKRCSEFAIIGAQKAASTSLQHWLRSSEDVLLIRGEVGVFEDPEWNSERARRKWSTWKSRAGNRILGIKRPNLLGEEVGLARLVKTAPQVQFIVILRDPVKRAFSALLHGYRYGQWDFDDPSRALVRLAKDGCGRLKYGKTVLSYGLYGEHLSRIVQRYPSNPLLIIKEEAILGDGARVGLALAQFLGIDSIKLLKIPNKNRRAGNVIRLHFFRQVTNLCFHRDPETGRLLLRRPATYWHVLHRLLASIDNSLLVHLFQSEAWSLSEEAKATLRDFYAEDQCLLMRLLEERSSIQRC